MKLEIGQVVEFKLKDGRKVKAVVKNFDEKGVVLEDALWENSDGTISTARITSVAFEDVILEPETPLEPKTLETEEVKPKRRVKK